MPLPAPCLRRLFGAPWPSGAYPRPVKSELAGYATVSTEKACNDWARFHGPSRFWNLTGGDHDRRALAGGDRRGAAHHQLGGEQVLRARRREAVDLVDEGPHRG